MVAVIGDIHGCLNTLKDLIDRLNDKYNDLPLYCVGDLIDRGNFSFETIEYVKEMNITFTPGNHDYMFYYFIKHPATDMGASWIYNGFETTISSYNDRFEKIAEHIELIKSAPLFINLEDCFISHAGISKSMRKKLPKDLFENIEETEKALKNKIESDSGILWTREQLADLGKLQIVGHTRQYEIKYLKENNVAYIDTSVYTGNKLSAVIVDKNEIVDSLSVPTRNEDIK